MKKGVDRSRVQQAMLKLAAEQKEQQEAARAREKELAAVKVRLQTLAATGLLAPACPADWHPLHAVPQVAAADVELVAQQFDLDKKRAERALREAKGDVKAALRSLLAV